jgi:hypothetical protein
MQQSAMEIAAESQQPKYKRMAIVLALALPLWLGGWITAILSHAIKTEPAIAACVGGGLFIIMLIFVSLLQLSQAKLHDLLRQQGFVSQSTKSSFWKGQVAVLPDDINQFFRAAAGVGSTGRAFRADVRTDDRGETWFIRHIIQQGKSSTTRNILLVRSANNWPRVFVHRRSIVDSVKKLFGTKTIPLEDPKFNEAVAIASSNPEFAILLMGPALQEIALSLKIGDELVIGGGAICFVTLSNMTTKNWARVMDLFERAQDAIPTELAEWQPAGQSH